MESIPSIPSKNALARNVLAQLNRGMRSALFYLHIPAEDIQRYYTGAVNSVLVRTVEGDTLQFPASVLTRVLTREGVYGEFELEYDEHNKNKFVALHRVNPNPETGQQCGFIA